jgi:hypothetical protein
MRTSLLWAVVGAPAIVLSLLSGACGSDGALGRSSSPDASLVDRVAAAPTPASGDGGASDADAEPPEPPCPDAGAGAPQELRCTGLYARWSDKTIAPDVRAYAPAVQFWSDGAEKQRWLYLPPGQPIDTTDMDDWVFPVGTKAWKEFRIGGKRIETRIYWKKSAATWVRTVYRWSADGETSATRLDTGATNVVGSYEIPQSIDCDQCHAGKKDRLLGVEAVNLGLAGASGVTLESLATEGRLSTAPPATTITLPNDVTGVAPAALGWMHANCGSCHARSVLAAAFQTGMFTRITVPQLFPDGGAPSVKDLDTYATAAGIDATQPAFVPLGMKRIAPGDADRSLVAYLAGRRDDDAGADSGTGQMPPLVTHVVDDAGVGSVRAWINAMPDGGL